MKLGEKIRELRKNKGISQEELAKLLNINRNYLSRIETGKSEPNSSILKKLVSIFNIDLNSLLDVEKETIENNNKIKFIEDNCRHLHTKDLDFIVRIISIMREEYVKINTDID